MDEMVQRVTHHFIRLLATVLFAGFDEGWRVMLLFQVDLHKLVQRQAARGCLAKLLHSLPHRVLVDFDLLDHVGNGSAEAVVAGGDEQGGAAQARGPSARVNPIAFHPLHQAEGCFRHVLRFVAEAHPVSVTHHIQTGIFKAKIRY